MEERVSTTEAIRAQIHEMFEANADSNLLSTIEQVASLSARLTFQSVIEDIVCEELGRGRYERRPVTEPDDLPPAYRNGWQKPRTLKAALGRWRRSARSCATLTPPWVTSCLARK